MESQSANDSIEIKEMLLEIRQKLAYLIDRTQENGILQARLEKERATRTLLVEAIEQVIEEAKKETLS